MLANDGHARITTEKKKKENKPNTIQIGKLQNKKSYQTTPLQIVTE